MLLNNFFNIINSTQISENEILKEIELNIKHDIYKGHFPENPVVPGVVSVQMINETLADHLELEFFVSKARSIKFSSMIIPNINPKLNFNIKYSESDDGGYKVIAQIYYEETIFLKFNGFFNKIC